MAIYVPIMVSGSTLVSLPPLARGDTVKSTCDSNDCQSVGGSLKAAKEVTFIRKGTRHSLRPRHGTTRLDIRRDIPFRSREREREPCLVCFYSSPFSVFFSFFLSFHPPLLLQENGSKWLPTPPPSSLPRSSWLVEVNDWHLGGEEVKHIQTHSKLNSNFSLSWWWRRDG